MRHDFPPWKTAYNYFAWFDADGTWQEILDALRERVRAAAGWEPTPSDAAVDSKSVKTAEGGAQRGADGGKRAEGLKRHILVDALGVLIAVAANADDGRAAPLLFAQAPAEDFPRPRVVGRGLEVPRPHPRAVAGGAAGPYRLAVVSRPAGSEGFAPLPVHSVVGRTFPSWAATDA